MFDNPQQLAAVAGAITATVGASTALANWLTSRRSQREFQANVADDLAVVQFWNAWLAFHQASSDDDALAQAKAKARAAVAGLPTFAERAEALTGRSALSLVLLLYPPPRPWCWLLRAPFYATALGAAAVFLTLVYDSFADSSGDPDALSTTLLMAVFAAALAGIAFLIRRIARRKERSP